MTKIAEKHTLAQIKIAKKYTPSQTRSPKEYTHVGSTSPATFSMEDSLWFAFSQSGQLIGIFANFKKPKILKLGGL